MQDNNPFSETFQVREQIMKMQHQTGALPPVSPSDAPTLSPGAQPPTTPGPPSTPRPGKLLLVPQKILPSMGRMVVESV